MPKQNCRDKLRRSCWMGFNQSIWKENGEYAVPQERFVNKTGPLQIRDTITRSVSRSRTEESSTMRALKCYYE